MDLSFVRLTLHVLFRNHLVSSHVLTVCLCFLPEAQLNRERVIQTVDSAVQGGEGRNVTPGLHQLPVRPVTQNGKHTTAVVATATSLANASGKLLQQSLTS